MVPKFLKAFEGKAMVPAGNKVVVVLQLSGGNDGLNTVIPVRNDIYYRSRPRIGVTREKAISLTDEVGLHPALSAFADAYHDGSLGILNNVGYLIQIALTSVVWTSGIQLVKATSTGIPAGLGAI